MFQVLLWVALRDLTYEDVEEGFIEMMHIDVLWFNNAESKKLHSITDVYHIYDKYQHHNNFGQNSKQETLRTMLISAANPQ